MHHEPVWLFRRLIVLKVSRLSQAWLVRSKLARPPQFKRRDDACQPRIHLPWHQATRRCQGFGISAMPRGPQVLFLGCVQAKPCGRSEISQPKATLEDALVHPVAWVLVSMQQCVERVLRPAETTYASKHHALLLHVLHSVRKSTGHMRLVSLVIDHLDCAGLWQLAFC